jgi:hypothetical protein
MRYPTARELDIDRWEPGLPTRAGSMDTFWKVVSWANNQLAAALSASRPGTQ